MSVIETPPYARRVCSKCHKPITYKWIVRNTNSKGTKPSKHSCGAPLKSPELCLHSRDETDRLSGRFGRCRVCGLLLEQHDTGYYFQVEGE